MVNIYIYSVYTSYAREYLNSPNFVGAFAAAKRVPGSIEYLLLWPNDVADIETSSLSDII